MAGWIAEVFRWGRRLFIIAKGLFILYLCVKSIHRYHKTRTTLLLFQIYMLFGILILDILLMAFEVHHDVNIIFSLFVINSLMKQASAYYIQHKCLEAIGEKFHSKK
jgi:hypothetical protein